MFFNTNVTSIYGKQKCILIKRDQDEAGGKTARPARPQLAKAYCGREFVKAFAMPFPSVKRGIKEI
jgi:hypothetical protein